MCVYGDRASREKKRMMHARNKKALKFSVSNNGELFYRHKRKGKASIGSFGTLNTMPNIQLHITSFLKSTDIRRSFTSVHSEYQ